MSTRSSLFYYDDPKSGQSIHIYEEVASMKTDDVRIEIEFQNGNLVNLPWPREAFKKLKREMVGEKF